MTSTLNQKSDLLKNIIMHNYMTKLLRSEIT